MGEVEQLAERAAKIIAADLEQPFDHPNERGRKVISEIAVLIAAFEAQVRADERKSPAITKLVEALKRSKFALIRCSQLESINRDFETQRAIGDATAALAELEGER